MLCLKEASSAKARNIYETKSGAEGWFLQREKSSGVPKSASNDVAEDFIQPDSLNDGATIGDVVGGLKRESLAGSSMPVSVLVPASLEGIVSASHLIILDFGVSIIFKGSVKSRETIRTATNQICQYPMEESSNPPIIGPRKAPELMMGLTIPIVFPKSPEPTVSAIVASDIIRRMDAAAPWKMRLKHKRYTQWNM